MTQVSIQSNMKEDLKKPFWNARRLAIMAIFIALSAVGSFIKIPSPVCTIGLDSAPGYFAALAFGGFEGAVIIALGHILTSAVVGFPLTIPLHLVIAVLMALWAISYRLINKKLGLIPAMVVATILNGVVSSFIMLPMGGMGAVIGVMPFLVAGSAINVVLSGIAYKALKQSSLLK
ncbi:MAG: ECF transporter S component [Peptococcaceae bacterium]|nr:ECF transporter S component [Peptococcaceae bacterium]